MVRNIKQTDKRLLPEIQNWGCLFMCFAEVSPLIFDGAKGCEALNNIWKQAIVKGYISGDLNHDGDLDDDGEAEILNHSALANTFFALSVKYDSVHHKSGEDIPSKVVFAFGRFVYKYGHFVVINRKKKVIYDPMGQSNTIKNGKLDTMRWYFSN